MDANNIHKLIVCAFFKKMAIAEIMCTVCSQGKCNNLIHHVTAIKACGLKWIDLIGCHDNFQVQYLYRNTV